MRELVFKSIPLPRRVVYDRARVIELAIWGGEEISRFSLRKAKHRNVQVHANAVKPAFR